MCELCLRIRDVGFFFRQHDIIFLLTGSVFLLRLTYNLGLLQNIDSPTDVFYDGLSFRNVFSVQQMQDETLTIAISSISDKETEK